MMRHASVFLSYAHRDDVLKQKLRRHLSVLERQGMISTWNDRDINAGSEIDSTIAERLRTADIILLLVSSDFLASEYCWSKEMQTAVARHQAGEAVVVPIILRPCDWKAAPFATLRALPTDGRPVVSRSWKDTDEAFADVAQGLRDALNSFAFREMKPSAASGRSVSIVLPTDGSRVLRQTLVRGSITDPTLEIWVIVHPEFHVHYWVQPPVKVEQGGSWLAAVYVGSESAVDVGAQFEIRAVAGRHLGLQVGQELTEWPKSDLCSQIVRVYRERA